MKENNSDQDPLEKQIPISTDHIAESEIDSRGLELLDDDLREMLSVIHRMQERIKIQSEKLPPMYHDIFSHTRHVAARGWYISPNVIRDVPLNEIVDLFQEVNAVRFEQLLIELADSIIERVLKRCSVRFPDRKVIFEEIADLYKLEFYRPVILLCYTQVDGMSNDFWGFGFFDKDRRQEYKLKSYLKLQELEKGINSGFAAQLEISMNEITVNSADQMFTSDAELQKRTFNRHHIMHGHSINYGTKTNAIRAIYLLDFFCYWTNDKDKSIYED